MNTPAHLLVGGALMGRGGDRRLVLAGMAGGLAPDLSLYLLAGVSLFLLDIAPRIVFDELYFSDLWQTIFAIDNSVLLWGAILALALWSGRAWAQAFAGAGLLHLAMDFPLHHDDGRPHFWPLTRWIFESPYSYWDRAHGALWIGPLETALALGCAVLIVWRRPGLWLTLFTLALAAAQLAIARVWMFVFAG